VFPFSCLWRTGRQEWKLVIPLKTTVLVLVLVREKGGGEEDTQSMAPQRAFEVSFQSKQAEAEAEATKMLSRARPPVPNRYQAIWG
jgi:hypothetical protein